MSARFRGAIANRTSQSDRQWLIFSLAISVLLAVFVLTLAGLTRESLWDDEAWTDWAIRSPYLAETLARVQADVHPPLYFLLLDGWTMVAGDSVFALRLPSILFGLLTLAAAYALGIRLFDRLTGLLTIILLGTTSFFVYYTREARMYSLLLAIAALATWAYSRWLARPTWGRAIGYGLLLALLLYTHYAGALIILTHFLHWVLTTIRHPAKLLRKLPCGLLPYLLALLLFAPWLPVFLSQMRANPHGPLALPLPTDGGTVAGLLLIVTSGYGGLMVLPFVLGTALPRLRQYGNAVLLLLLWLLLTPSLLLILNAAIAPVYQVRYTIAALPAGALLIAYGLRHIGLPILPTTYRQRLAQMITLALLLALVYGQLSTYAALWPGKPTWEAAIRHMTAARNPLEPTITDLAPYSPAAYYDQRLNLRQGVSLDLSWRLHHFAELQKLIALFDGEPAVWIALPMNTAKAWHITALLDAERGITYRASLVNLLFYRFDRNAAADLQFRLGDSLRYDDGPGADTQFDVRPGDELCADYTFTTLAPLDGLYSAGLHLVDLTGTQSAAQVDEGLGSRAAGEVIHFSPCLLVPPTTPPGYYHLELAVYNWSNGTRLPVLETGGPEVVNWGDVMRLAAVNISQ